MLREFEYCNGIVLIIDVVVVIIFIIFWEESNSCKATWTCYRKTRQLAYFCHLFFYSFLACDLCFNFCVVRKDGFCKLGLQVGKGLLMNPQFNKFSQWISKLSIRFCPIYYGDLILTAFEFIITQIFLEPTCDVYNQLDNYCPLYIWMISHVSGFCNMDRLFQENSCLDSEIVVKRKQNFKLFPQAIFLAEWEIHVTRIMG